MKNKWINFRLRQWHFGAAFAGLIALTNTMAYIGMEKETNKKSTITEADNEAATGTNFVLFYADNSKPSNIMEQNMHNSAQSLGGLSSIKFNKINLTKHPELLEKHQISGVPSILIFKDGEEIKRITGVVSESNLRFIYRKIAN